MTDRTITLTPTEAEKFAALAVGESMWIVREGADCTLGDHCYAAHDDNAQHPPVEFVQACAPCETCGDERRVYGYLRAGSPCPDCRIELVGPCAECGGSDACLPGGITTLGYAYAVANATTGRCEPLPIVEMAGSAGMGERVYGTAADPWHWRDDSDTGQTKITAALAHYGPPESLVGQWAIEVRKL